MSQPGYVPGLPGVRTAVEAVARLAFRSGQFTADLSGGKVISGAHSRDSGNTGDLDVLRAGLPMGKITSGGEYAPAIIGVTAGAEAVGSTEIAVTAAQAVELVRRVGSTGTFILRGPATAGGPVDSETVTYSAVNTSTGAVTVTALTKPFVAGSFAQPADGSDVPLTLIPDGYGVKVTDHSGASIDVEFAPMPIAGLVDSSQIIHWPSEVSLQRWIVDAMRSTGAAWIFDHGF